MSDQPPTPDEAAFQWEAGWAYRPTGSAPFFMPSSPAQVEPSAAHREMAQHFRAAYVAMVNEGFTAAEAMTLIVAMIQKPS